MQKEKLIICGTGRAGTTLLMRILTAAGTDTGFNEQHLRNVAANIGRAGLEKPVNKANKDRLPQVLKSPHFVDLLPKVLSEEWFKIGLAVVPVRDLDAAAKSRVQVHEKALESGGDASRAPGGLWKTKNPREQRWVLAAQFYRTVEALIVHDVPIAFVSFPRFALDREYFNAKFATVVHQRMGFDRSAIMDAYTKECRPEMISVKES